MARGQTLLKFIGVGSFGVGMYYSLNLIATKPKISLPTTNRKLENKTIIVTGGTSGIGRRLTEQLSVRYGAKVIVAARDLEKCRAMKEEIEKMYNDNEFGDKVKHQLTDPEDKIECKLCDLKNFQSVADFCKSLGEDQKIDSLINNAAIMRPTPSEKYEKVVKKQVPANTRLSVNNENTSQIERLEKLTFLLAKTTDDLEETLQVNAISPYFLSKLLVSQGKLETKSNDGDADTIPSIINITCDAQRYADLKLHDLNLMKTVEDAESAKYDARTNLFYRNSKLCNILLTKELSRENPSLKIIAVDWVWLKSINFLLKLI